MSRKTARAEASTQSPHSTGHRRARGWRIVLGALALVLTAACNDDPADPAAALTDLEAEALFRGISALTNDTTLEVTEVSGTEAVVACPLGGEARGILDGSDGQRGDTLWLIVDVEIIPADCGFAHDGVEFTLASGNLRNHTEMSMVGFFEDLDIEGTLVGAVQWEVEDRSGDCAVDLELEVELDLTNPSPTPQGVFRGTMCGEEVEYKDVVVPIPSA